jgi:hypothetical protein
MTAYTLFVASWIILVILPVILAIIRGALDDEPEDYYRW